MHGCNIYDSKALTVSEAYVDYKLYLIIYKYIGFIFLSKKGNQLISCLLTVGT